GSNVRDARQRPGRGLAIAVALGLLAGVRVACLSQERSASAASAGTGALAALEELRPGFQEDALEPADRARYLRAVLDLVERRDPVATLELLLETHAGLRPGDSAEDIGEITL